MSTPTPFDLTGPLPSGTTVLEASAGTGKTYTIAALTARYLADGVPLSALMLVTFGRNASQELRLRVRERLVDSEAALLAAVSGGVCSARPDEAMAMLTDGPPDLLALRRERLAAALAEFDAATIATTHEFCLQMLDGLGVLADREPQAVFVEHLRELTREVVGDVFLRRYAVAGVPPLRWEEAQRVGAAAVESVHAQLVPVPDPDEPDDVGGPAVERLAFALDVRAEVERRKAAGRLFTYDDMLTRLRDALADPTWGEQAAARLRARYQVVMVDEFQDTDPVQWEILRRAFHGHATLVLIGDPKQAIYAFRGADVYSYLDARAVASQVHTLDTSYRSDAALVQALGAVMGGAALGDEQIVVRPVTASHAERRLARRDQTGSPAPLRVRVHAHDPESAAPPPVGDVRPVILRDLVADVTEALATLQLRPDEQGWRPLQPADIAVLVHTNRRGEEVRQALVDAGVPAVMLGASSVFGSELAQEWLTLLTALEQPRQPLVRRTALTPFVGWTFERLATADDDALTELSQRVRTWSRVLAARGVAALLETVSTDTDLPGRLLGTVGGERALTDLRHVAEALHRAMVAGPLGRGELRAWLAEQIEEAQLRTLGDGSRRLETEDKAVQVVTVHRSKGLEYPVVYLPDAWDRHVNTRDEGGLLKLHQEGRSVLDVGGQRAPGRSERFAAHLAEEAGESLRLLYVAMTRAQCQVVTWWAPSRNTEASPLQRFWYRSDAAGAVPAAAYPLQGDLTTAPVRGPGVVCEPLQPREPTPWQPVAPEPPTLDLRTFGRGLDLRWRRTSYSALTAGVHGQAGTTPAVGSEPEPAHEDDEAVELPLVGLPADVSPDEPLGRPSPLAELPSGTEFGTAVHSVLELVDPTADDLTAELRRACASALGRAGSALVPDQLAGALLPVLRTPLGELAGHRRLADIAPADRLTELGFELPLAGGDQIRAEVALGGLASLLRRHLRADDPLAGYADLLAHPTLAEQPLRGYLTGSIDAVLRVDDGGPRYLVVDYKTNWLGPFDGRPLTLGRYTRPRMAEAMQSAHYPLQALLYAVALHRMLRWRQPGYAPETHLGGVLYLFVRGMAGEDTPVVDGTPCGVFSWLPPPRLVVELSDLLDGRSTEEHQ